MNKKVSSNQILMLFSLIFPSLYLGISDTILLSKSNDSILLTLFFGFLIGFVPVIIYLKVNDSFHDLNIYQKVKKLFNKKISFLLNTIILLYYLFFLIVSLSTIIIFVTSKYLESTPYFLIGSLVLFTVFIINKGEIETLARISQLTFIFSIVLTLIIEIFLIKYVDLNNILPIVGTKLKIKNLTDSVLYYLVSSPCLILLLLVINKSKINDYKNFNKCVFFYYIISSFLFTIVMFFIVSCFGYKLAYLFRFPEYVILKKIGLNDTESHLENLLAFRWIFYLLALCNISVYGIKSYLKCLIPCKNYINVFLIAFCFLSVLLGSFIFNNSSQFLYIISKYYLFFSIPFLLIFVLIYIKCFFIKKNNIK